MKIKDPLFGILSPKQLRSALLKTLIGEALLMGFSLMLLILASILWQRETQSVSLDRVVVFSFSQPGIARSILVALMGALPFVFILSILDELSYERRLRRLFWALKDVGEGKRSPTEGFDGTYEEQIAELLGSYSILARDKGVNLNSQFLSDAGHEIRTPLSIIKGRIELALMKERSGPYYKEKLEDVLRQVCSLERLTKGILELSRLEGMKELDLGMTDLSIVAEEALSSLKDQIRAKGQRVKLVTEEAPVLGDEDMLVQMCRAILDNASKYSPNGSLIEMTVRRDDKGGLGVISVKDYGIGMDPGTAVKCFQPFWRKEASRSSEGYGLGLSMAQRIARLHGGHISVRSTDGMGSTFTFSMPLKEGE
jgi:signal transduction histidine kinase